MWTHIANGIPSLYNSLIIELVTRIANTNCSSKLNTGIVKLYDVIVHHFFKNNFTSPCNVFCLLNNEDTTWKYHAFLYQCFFMLEELGGLCWINHCFCWALHFYDYPGFQGFSEQCKKCLAFVQQKRRKILLNRLDTDFFFLWLVPILLTQVTVLVIILK